MKLSNQGAGALLMALQKCLLEETDITGILKDMDFTLDSNEELIVSNPPVFHAEADLPRVLIPDA
jgi:hypothetical protein